VENKLLVSFLIHLGPLVEHLRPQDTDLAKQSGNNSAKTIPVSYRLGKFLASEFDAYATRPQSFRSVINLKQGFGSRRTPAANAGPFPEYLTPMGSPFTPPTKAGIKCCQQSPASITTNKSPHQLLPIRPTRAGMNCPNGEPVRKHKKSTMMLT